MQHRNSLHKVRLCNNFLIYRIIVILLKCMGFLHRLRSIIWSMINGKVTFHLKILKMICKICIFCSSLNFYFLTLILSIIHTFIWAVTFTLNCMEFQWVNLIVMESNNHNKTEGFLRPNRQNIVNKNPCFGQLYIRY